MTDESVLNSLFAFARNTPPIYEYQLDKGPQAYLVHFGVNPKPWKMWQLKHLKYFDLVISFIEWAQEKGYKTPPIPWSLRKENKIICHIIAHFLQVLVSTKHKVGLIRSMHK
jgi:hypothetical protein